MTPIVDRLRLLARSLPHPRPCGAGPTEASLRAGLSAYERLALSCADQVGEAESLLEPCVVERLRGLIGEMATATDAGAFAESRLAFVRAWCAVQLRLEAEGPYRAG
jgi:hypothetical protein